jgi:hypothetical protein
MTRSRNTADTQTASGGPVPPFTAGKNAIINGDFRYNQRNFTSISGLADTYGFDRFKLVAGSGATYTPQTFTAGAAPVAGYEGVNFARIVTTGQSGTGVYSILGTTIEDVRVLSGQTATVSFWAKSASGTPKISLELIQVFGTGGSPSSNVNTYAAQSTISTSWTRYSMTITIPSISGKTIGTTANTSCTAFSFWVSAGTDFNARTGSLGIQSNTFDIWGVQVEAGPTATPFETATGTIQGELAACQRYYYRAKAGSQSLFGSGQAFSTTNSTIIVPYPVQMRITPTALEQSGTASDYGVYVANGGLAICSAVPSQSSLGNTENQGLVLATVASGLVAGNSAPLSSRTSNAYLGWSAEL